VVVFARKSIYKFTLNQSIEVSELVGLIITVQSNNVRWDKHSWYFSSENNILFPSWKEYVLLLKKETTELFSELFM
jgi:hypothetical protein